MVQMTPGAWLAELEAMLDRRQPSIRLYTNYRNGQHRLRYATAKYRQAFGGLFREFADNWCREVINAPVERLRVQGFRFGATTAADDDAWAIWQENKMDAAATLVHREAITCCESYWLIDPLTKIGPEGLPRITCEHPSQMIVATDPTTGETAAALKRWVDLDGYAYANVYLPDTVHKWVSSEKPRGASRITWRNRRDTPTIEHDLGAVPAVPITNAADMLVGGQSDLMDAVPLQDAITKEVLDMLVASEFGAFKQRVLIGMEAPTDSNGRPLSNPDVAVAMSKLLTISNPDGKIAEFGATDLKNYVNAIEMLVQHFAAQTRTPPHYLLGSIVNASGDALKAAEAGLVARTREKMIPFGEGHEEALRLAFKAAGEDQKAQQTRAETIWADPEFRSFGELVDGLVKLKALGIPDEILWERGGFSPTEIARIKEMQATDAFLNPAPPMPTAPTVNGPFVTTREQMEKMDLRV